MKLLLYAILLAILSYGMDNEVMRAMTRMVCVIFGLIGMVKDEN